MIKPHELPQEFGKSSKNILVIIVSASFSYPITFKPLWHISRKKNHTGQTIPTWAFPHSVSIKHLCNHFGRLHFLSSEYIVMQGYERVMNRVWMFGECPKISRWRCRSSGNSREFCRISPAICEPLFRPDLADKILHRLKWSFYNGLTMPFLRWFDRVKKRTVFLTV